MTLSTGARLGSGCGSLSRIALSTDSPTLNGANQSATKFEAAA